MRERFKNAVEGRVRDNLADNRSYVCNEMERSASARRSRAPRSPSRTRPRAARDADRRRARRQGPGGHGQDAPHPGRETTRSIDTGAAFTIQVDCPILRPGGAAEPGRPGTQDWAAVKKEYDKLDRYIKQAMAQSPALFALVEAGGAGPGRVRRHVAEEARAKIQPLLQALIGKIDEADGLVGEDLDYREMGPVIEQLMGTPEWSGQHRAAAHQGHARTYNRDKMLRSLGLSAISALGFLFATFATGGAAVFIGAAVGVGASATQAGSRSRTTTTRPRRAGRGPATPSSTS